MMKYRQGDELADKLIPQLNRQSIEADCKFFGELDRYSGTPDGEKAASYILSRLSEAGIPSRGLSFTGYLSHPVTACAAMTSPLRREINAKVCGFSRPADNLEGELYYDSLSEKNGLSQLEQAERFAKFKGKIVLTRAAASQIAADAERAGALALICMYPSDEKVSHFTGASTLWGTPTPENAHLLLALPAINTTKECGEMLISHLAGGRVTVSITTKIENGLREATIPTCFIQGESDNFVLISGHYDSHFRGMTDNGAGAAIMLELARVLYKNRGLLKRSVAVCWWAGHEYGNYAGSSWFADNYWQELRDRCVAHINVDVAGCRDARQIRPRTTRMEGRVFTDSLIKEFTGLEPKPYIPLPHNAEQSFLGREIPITIMLKYEIEDEKRYFSGAGGGYWWHTEDDTLDKVDYDICIRDASINLKMALRIIASEHIPVELSQFVDDAQRLLSEVDARLDAEFDMAPAFYKLEQLRGAVRRLEQAIPGQKDTDAIIKRVAGELIRIVFTHTPAYDFDFRTGFSNYHVFRRAMGMTRDNTDENVYTFTRTGFIRQRNRLTGELDRVMEAIDEQLFRWGA